MITRPFGTTGLVVSALGLGAGPLGDARLSDAGAARLLDAALDLGVTLIDTARSYGESEARIGRALRGRRSRAVLSTKVGYGVEGVADWTAQAVHRGIDEALTRLGADHIDIVHLHSCPEHVLRGGEVTGALSQAVTAGKVRVAAYSGENQALDSAVASGAFGSVQLSLNPWDQGSIDRVLWRAKDRGMGAIAKRPLANAFWILPERSSRPDVADYQDRARALALPDFGLPLEALSLRFAVFTWGIDAAIAGTTRPAHLESLARIVADGPLPDDIIASIRAAWRTRAAAWPGLV